MYNQSHPRASLECIETAPVEETSLTRQMSDPPCHAPSPMRHYGGIYNIRAPRFLASRGCEAIMTIEGTIDLWHVPPTASLTSRKVVREIAVYSRRELGNDFASYSLQQTELLDSAFLITHTSDTKHPA